MGRKPSYDRIMQTIIGELQTYAEIHNARQGPDDYLSRESTIESYEQGEPLTGPVGQKEHYLEPTSEGRAANFLLLLQERHGSDALRKFLDRFIAYSEASEDALMTGKRPPKLHLSGDEKKALRDLHAPIKEHDTIMTRCQFVAALGGIFATASGAAYWVTSTPGRSYIEKKLTEMHDEHKVLSAKPQRTQEETERMLLTDKKIRIIKGVKKTLDENKTGLTTVTLASALLGLVGLRFIHLAEKETGPARKEAMQDFLCSLEVALDDVLERMPMTRNELKERVAPRR